MPRSKLNWSRKLMSGLFCYHCHSHYFNGCSRLYFSCSVLNVSHMWLLQTYLPLPYLQSICLSCCFVQETLPCSLPDLVHCPLFSLSKVITLISLIHNFRLRGALWDSHFSQPFIFWKKLYKICVNASLHIW